MGRNRSTPFCDCFLACRLIHPTTDDTELRAVGRAKEIHPKKWKVKTEVYTDETCCVKGEVMAATFKK